jgi:hypothetical protein
MKRHQTAAHQGACVGYHVKVLGACGSCANGVCGNESTVKLFLTTGFGGVVCNDVVCCNTCYLPQLILPLRLGLLYIDSLFTLTETCVRILN